MAKKKNNNLWWGLGILAIFFLLGKFQNFSFLGALVPREYVAFRTNVQNGSYINANGKWIAADANFDGILEPYIYQGFYNMNTPGGYLIGYTPEGYKVNSYIYSNGVRNALYIYGDLGVTAIYVRYDDMSSVPAELSTSPVEPYTSANREWNGVLAPRKVIYRTNGVLNFSSSIWIALDCNGDGALEGYGCKGTADNAYASSGDALDPSKRPYKCIFNSTSNSWIVFKMLGAGYNDTYYLPTAPAASNAILSTTTSPEYIGREVYASSGQVVYDDRIICGDEICEADETTETCPADCEIIPPCQEDWSCTAWSECSSNTQSRSCSDNNDCGTTNSKPATSQECLCISAEITCDGQDDDCDGQIDEGVKNICIDYSTCTQYQQCSACSTTNIPVEVCDGEDNDCNGIVDETVKNSCRDYNTCQVFDSCNTCATAPVETCNDEDDDCDGVVDEGCSCVNGRTQTCGSTEVGECALGTQACANGQWSNCTGAIMAVTEICDNNKDDDCDGTTDEQCPVIECTTNNQCDDSNTSTTNQCVSNKCVYTVPVVTNPTCDPACTGDQVCENGTCKAKQAISPMVIFIVLGAIALLLFFASMRR